MAYATPTDMKRRYDVNRLGQLVRDNGSCASADELENDPLLLEALDDASGMVESAVLVGGRYSVKDLNELVDTPAKMLSRLVCDICYGLLVQRRGFSAGEQAMLAPGYDRALKLLEKIENGAWIFANDLAIAAGKPTRAQLSQDVILITGQSSQGGGARRYFGVLDENNGQSIR